MNNKQFEAVCQAKTTEILDSTKTPKFKKFKEKKEANLKLCKFAQEVLVIAALDLDIEGGEIPNEPHMTGKLLRRIEQCSTWVKFAAPEDFSKLKKIEGFVCSNAFCPVCAAYQSKRDALKLSAIMAAMQDLKNIYNASVASSQDSMLNASVASSQDSMLNASVASSQDCMLTLRYGEKYANRPFTKIAAVDGVEFAVFELTTPNVTGDKLKAEIVMYAKKFDLLIKNWLVREYPQYLGFARKLEVTYNKQERITKEMWFGEGKYNKPMKWRFKHMGKKIGDRNPFYNTYHPHYHVVLAVTPDFFYYDEFGDEKPIISKQILLAKWKEITGNNDITQVHIQKAYSTDTGNTALEIAKYVAKDTDMLHSPQVLKVFYQALKGAKRLTMGGLFQDTHKLFKEKQLDRYIPADVTDYVWSVIYSWQGQDFKENKRSELTRVEAAKIRGMKYDEANDTDDF